MSLLPLFYRDLWDDTPSRLFDQNFGLGLYRNDLENLLQSPLTSGLYMRPWRETSGPSRGISTLQADKNNFNVTLDVQQFKPNEISVKTVDRAVIVEGKHDEKQDEHGFISRHFLRKYLLPDNVDPQEIQSSLSSDGLLTIAAPKKVPEVKGGERVVPIQRTGPSKPAEVGAAPDAAGKDKKDAKKGGK